MLTIAIYVAGLSRRGGQREVIDKSPPDRYSVYIPECVLTVLLSLFYFLISLVGTLPTITQTVVADGRLKTMELIGDIVLVEAERARAHASPAEQWPLHRLMGGSWDQNAATA